MASQAAIAQHARYMLQEAIAWLIGAGVAQRTIHQDVDRLTTQLQETDPPFRTRIGEWFFDGTHWTLRPKTVYAAAGWVPWLVGQESSASVYVAATALRDMALREQSPPYPWYAILGNLPFGTVDVHVRDDRNLSIMRAYLLRRVGRSVRGFPLVFVQPDSWDESSDIRTPL